MIGTDPILLIPVLLKCVCTCRVFLQKLHDSIDEGRGATSHYLVQCDSLFGRVFVVVLLDGDIASADAYHTILTFNRHLFSLSANQVHILLLKLDNGHEGA